MAEQRPEQEPVPEESGRRLANRGLALLLLVLLVAAAAFLLPLAVQWAAAIYADRARLAAIVREAGVWGPALLVGLTAAQVVLAPIPGQAIDFVAAYVYGFWLGGFYAWLGLLLGSLIAMALARLAGRPLVERLVSPQALARFDRYAEGQGLLFFFLVFLIPFLPDDLACFVAGLTPLPLVPLLMVAGVGRIPGLIGAVWLGSHAESITWPVWLVTAVISLVAGLLAWRYGERIQQALLGRARGSPDQGRRPPS